MSNCSDTGLQGSSPRDARFMRFVVDGPGIAGFSMKLDSEEDGDAFAASFDPFLRPENTETCFSEWDDDGRHLSLEALAAESGFEPADSDSLEAVEAYEGGDEEEEDDYPDDEDERPRAVMVFRDGESMEIPPRRERRSNGRLYWESVVEPRVEAARIVSKALAVEEARKTDKTKPEPTKGNGHKPATPPVGKFLAGTVIDQGPKGLLVDIGNGLEARVPIADEYGHGSWQAAAAWLMGFKPGARVRIKVIRQNGHIEAVLADRHPRPFWRKEARQQVEARPAN